MTFQIMLGVIYVFRTVSYYFWVHGYGTFAVNVFLNKGSDFRYRDQIITRAYM